MNTEVDNSGRQNLLLQSTDSLENIRGRTMVHQKWKRHLSFEELDKRIAMNSDANPLRSIAFELPAKIHGPSFEMQNVLLSERASSVAIQQFEMRQFDSQQIQVQQIAIPRFVPRYEFIRFNPRQLVGKMIGEGEGRVGSDHAPPSLLTRVQGIVIPEGEVVKSANPSRVPDPIASPVVPLPAGLIAVKQDLQRSTHNPTQSQVISRPESIVLIALSPSAQPNVLTPSASIRTIDAAPLSDVLTARSVVHPVSASPQEVVFQPKAALNVTAVVSPTARELTQTDFVARKRIESTKPTKDGMFLFSMDTGYVTTKSGPSSSPQMRGSRQSEVDSRQLQRTHVESTIDALATNTKRLPVPNGMIEIREIVENSPRPELVAKANVNPFEILQLFIGSSNMMQSPVSSESRSANASVVGLDSKESTENASNEDIVVTLGIGAVLAIALRERNNRKRTNPLNATVRPPVA